MTNHRDVDWFESFDFDAYRDGTLDKRQRDELIAWLAADPDNARVFAEFCLLDEDLHDLVGNGIQDFAALEPIDRDSNEASETDKASAAIKVSESLQANHRARGGNRWSPLRMVLTLGLVGMIGLAGFLALERWRPDTRIATVSGASGFLEWTAANGQVASSPSVGDALTGGTIEGLTPESWFELTFDDGTKVMISGKSSLTFSEVQQKELYLRNGALSADVNPQPSGSPLLVKTRTAAIEVVGTRFNVDADTYSTTLNVSKGRVRIQTADSAQVTEVASGFRAVAELGKDLQMGPVPKTVHQWKSGLQQSGVQTLGRWVPGTKGSPAKLQTVPYVTEFGHTIFAAGCGVSYGNSLPVVCLEGSTIRMVGHMETASDVFIGVTVRNADGDFVGRFQKIWNAEKFSNETFQVDTPLNEFRLDPVLLHAKDRLASAPKGLVVESVWCHTLYRPAGLSIIELEIIPP